jgi:Tol biopolymer transport system component
MIDLAGKKQVLVKGPIRGQGIAWAPSGKEIWFDDRGERGQFVLRAVDLDGSVRTLSTMPAGLLIHDIAPDGRVLAERYDSQASVVALAPGEPRERDLSWFDRSNLAGLSDDGSLVLINETGDAAGPDGDYYVRRTDGSPAVRLGEGSAFALSPDGKWVVSRQRGSRSTLILTPTGTGAPTPLDETPLELVQHAVFFPDGKRLLLAGSEPGGSLRLYVQDLPSGKPRAISKKRYGFGDAPISPDGTRIAAYGEWSDDFFVLPAGGGEPTQIPGTKDLDLVRWAQDGRSIYCASMGKVPTRLFRVDVASGRREPWKDIGPADLSGVIQLSPLFLTPDAKSYAFGFSRAGTSDLYLVEGLR